MARRHNNSGFRSRAGARHVSNQEAAAVAAQMESLGKDGEPIQSDVAEKELSVGLARNIGELSTGLAFRYNAFFETMAPYLPPQLVRHKKTLPGRSLLFAKESRILQVAKERLMTRHEAVGHLLGCVPTASKPITAEVTGIWPPLPPPTTPPTKVVKLREIYLVFDNPTMHEEALALETPEFRPAVLLTNASRDRSITAQTLSIIIAGAREAFVGQPVTFGPMVPLLPSANRDQTGP